MDIGINCEKGTFKLRSCGVIVKDGKMLVDRARRFDGYVFLGGHIAIGENSEEAIKREALEELGIDIKVKRLICVNENIYPLPNTENVAHEVAYYYEVEPCVEISEDGLEHREIDNGIEIVHKYTWISLDEARDNNVRPCWLADLILNKSETQFVLTDQTK